MKKLSKGEIKVIYKAVESVLKKKTEYSCIALGYNSILRSKYAEFYEKNKIIWDIEYLDQNHRALLLLMFAETKGVL